MFQIHVCIRNPTLAVSPKTPARVARTYKSRSSLVQYLRVLQEKQKCDGTSNNRKSGKFDFIVPSSSLHDM
jgi:hypothetical protein